MLHSSRKKIVEELVLDSETKTDVKCMLETVTTQGKLNNI